MSTENAVAKSPEEITAALNMVAKRCSFVSSTGYLQKPPHGGLLEHKTSACFDGLHREPVDLTAALVVSRGIRYEPTGRVLRPHFESQPPIINYLRHRELRPTDNLTGRKRGRLTVVGKARDVLARWVVRCACGKYEYRTAKAIKNRANNEDACEYCRKVMVAKRAHEYRTRTGAIAPAASGDNALISRAGETND